MIKRNVTMLNGATLLLSSMLGAGMLGVSKSFVLMGYLGGSLFTFLIMLLTLLSIIFLISSSYMAQVYSYDDLCDVIPLGSTFYNLIVMLNCYGATSGYFLMIIKYLSQIYSICAETTHENIAHFQFYSSIGLVIFLIIFCSIESNFLLRVIGNILGGLSFLVCSLVVYYGMKLKYKKEETVLLGNNLLDGLPAIIFAIVCQQCVFQIHNSFRDGSPKYAFKSFAIGCVFGLIFYLIIGNFSYLAFGSYKNADFLEILSSKEFVIYIKKETFDKSLILPKVLLITFIIILIGSFKFQSLAAQNALFKILNVKTLLGFTANIVHLGLSWLLYYYNIQPNCLLKLVGSIISPMIGFMLPSLIFIKVKVSGNAVGLAKCMFYGSLALMCILFYCCIKVNIKELK